jgi:ParB-like chromosome segregation protein Spo0J
MTVESVPLAKIDFSPGNPRRDATEDLDGMAASLGDEENSMLVNPPLVQKVARGRYRVVAGERRVRAAQLKGWTFISCQVREVDAHTAHTLRVIENLHRRELNPLDQALALKISWLVANGDALGLRAKVEAALAKEQSQAFILSDLEALLEESGFNAKRPPVPWDDILNQLGVEMKPDSRKKLMRVLSVDPKAQETVRDLGLTEAALRSMGTLDAKDQNLLAKEVKANPNLKRKIRRIARVVRAGKYSLAKALAEAKGQVSLSIEDEDESAARNVVPEDERVTDEVIRLLESATAAQQAVDNLRSILGNDYLNKLPDSWRGYAEEAIKIARAI